MAILPRALTCWSVAYCRAVTNMRYFIYVLWRALSPILIFTVPLLWYAIMEEPLDMQPTPIAVTIFTQTSGGHFFWNRKCNIHWMNPWVIFVWYITRTGIKLSSVIQVYKCVLTNNIWHRGYPNKNRCPRISLCMVEYIAMSAGSSEPCSHIFSRVTSLPPEAFVGFQE